MQPSYTRVKLACYTSNIAMSVVSNLSPLLFLTFRSLYGISYSLLGLLVLVNFVTQLSVDLIFSFFSHKFNIEKSVKAIPILTASGLLLYAAAPLLFPNMVYLGLVLGTVVFAASGGFVEVLLSPVIAAIPSENPDREMSKLHSVYAWGVVGVVLFSSLFLLLCGAHRWQWLVLLLVLIPVFSAVLFFGAKFPPMEKGEKASGTHGLFGKRILWVCFLGLFLGGAAECTMAQWSSGYLEQALGIPKIWGDVFGVALFAMMLGSADPAFNLSASLKMYTDILNSKSALAASVSTGGVSLADLLFTVADKSVAVSSNALFGNDVYGFSTENFAESFNKSEFGENGACSLGITAEEVDSLLGTFMTSLTDYAKAADEMLQKQKTLTDASDALKADLYPMIESHGTIETVDGTLSVGGAEVPTDDIVFTYTGEQLEALFTDVLTLLRDHESVRTMIDAFVDIYFAYYSEDMLEMLEIDPAVLNADEIYTEYVATVDELLAEVADMSEDFAGLQTVVAVHIAKDSEEVAGVSVDVDKDGEQADVRFVCGPSAADVDEISFSVKTSGTEDYEMRIAYEVETDDESAYSAKLSVNDNGYEEELFSFRMDKTSGEYVLSVTAEGQTIGLGGKYTEEKDCLAVTVNTVSVSGVSINFGEIAMIFRTGDPVPTNGAYPDILTMRAEEIEAVAQDIVTAFEEIASVFGG